MPLRGGVRRLMANAILNFHFDFLNPSLMQRNVTGLDLMDKKFQEIDSLKLIAAKKATVLYQSNVGDIEIHMFCLSYGKSLKK